MSFLSHFNLSDFDLIGAEGQIKGSYKGNFSDTSVNTEDISIDAVSGDEIRRKIPNGREEVFDVISSSYHDRFHAIDAHFVIKTRRKGLMDAGTGGNYVRVHGNNARVFIGSTDNSTNIHSDAAALYQQIRSALSEIDGEKRNNAELALRQMESATSPKDRLKGYQSLISSLADHVTILAPFLPALTGQLS